MCALLLVLGCAAVQASEDVVHIKSKYSSPPLITSSTLRWVKKGMGERSEAAVVGAYEIVQGKSGATGSTGTRSGRSTVR